MTLDIIITHYKEPWELGYEAFEMIRMQRCIDFNKIHVYVVQDGEDGALPKEKFEGYPYEITVLNMPHGGVSAARNYGMDAGMGTWVLFHDFDDAFASTYALFHVFEKMNDDHYNLIGCEWIGEQKYGDTGAMWLRPGDGNDFAFIHGKFLRRSWLYQNNIRFNPELTIHEDAYFMCLVRLLMPEDQVCILHGLQYSTHYNSDSVTRSNMNEFFRETYEHFFKKADALIHELVARGEIKYAVIIAGQTICDTYLNMARRSWEGHDLSKIYADTKAFAKRNTALIDSFTPQNYIDGLNAARVSVNNNNDMGFESVTFKDWLRDIRSDDD